jgi:hypothetical protein
MASVVKTIGVKIDVPFALGAKGGSPFHGCGRRRSGFCRFYGLRRRRARGRTRISGCFGRLTAQGTYIFSLRQFSATIKALHKYSFHIRIIGQSRPGI